MVIIRASRIGDISVGSLGDKIDSEWPINWETLNVFFRHVYRNQWEDRPNILLISNPIEYGCDSKSKKKVLGLLKVNPE